MQEPVQLQAPILLQLHAGRRPEDWVTFDLPNGQRVLGWLGRMEDSFLWNGVKVSPIEGAIRRVGLLHVEEQQIAQRVIEKAIEPGEIDRIRINPHTHHATS